MNVDKSGRLKKEEYVTGNRIDAFHVLGTKLYNFDVSVCHFFTALKMADPSIEYDSAFSCCGYMCNRDRCWVAVAVAEADFHLNFHQPAKQNEVSFAEFIRPATRVSFATLLMIIHGPFCTSLLLRWKVFSRMEWLAWAFLLIYVVLAILHTVQCKLHASNTIGMPHVVGVIVFGRPPRILRGG